MTRFRFLVPVVTVALLAGLLTGCPWWTPVLDVNPKTISFGTEAVAADFTIQNAGGGQLTWTLDELVRADADAPWVVQDVPWLTSSTTSGTTQVAQPVRLQANRAGQVVGNYSNVGVRVHSNGGDVILPVTMSIAPSVSAAPSKISLAPGATTAQFQVINSNITPADWRIRYLPNPSQLSSATDLPAGLVASPDQGVTVAGEPATVVLSWQDITEDFSVLVESDMGDAVVSLVFGALLEGLDVTPSTLRIFLNKPEGDSTETPEQPESKLSLTNVGAVSKTWTAEIVDRANPSQAAPLALSPSNGTIAPAVQQQIGVKATDLDTILLGAGNYDLILHSGESFLIVPLIVENRPLPAIAISEAPQTGTSRPEIISMDVLDFGRDKIQAEFWIANTGQRGSKLYFKITNDDASSAKPLIAGIAPETGGVNGEDGSPNDFYHPTRVNELIDGRAITVTINRANLKEEVEFREITVQAYDKDPSVDATATPLDAVDSVTLQVRVEQQPLTIEGAMNLSRPPYVLRWALLLRDQYSNVVPTRTKADLEHINFTVSEDGVPVDFTETSMFLQGPENLKVNLVVLLDYTGSMYYAGVDSTGAQHKEPGEAVDDMKNAVAGFLDDIPSSYRVALMYYNDRNQTSRLIHAFSTNRDALKEAMNNFTIPEAQFGVSAINDALLEAIDRLAAEDSGQTLPFDGADVRGVVYITNGFDNASTVAESEVASSAKDNRVRLFPVAYAPNEQVDMATLLVAANDSGGRFYNAENVDGLKVMLANAKSLALSPSASTGADFVQFDIANAGDSTIDWTISGMEEAPWIQSVSPNLGVIPPDGKTTVVISFDENAAVVNETTYAATLDITAGTDTGSVALTYTPHAGADPDVAMVLRDEPGTIWNDLRNQVVFTYITPKQSNFQYSLRAEYTDSSGKTFMGLFDDAAFAYTGNVRVGQIAMSCSGIVTAPNNPDVNAATQAEIFVRTDYVPRNTDKFRVRFWLDTLPGAPEAAQTALEDAQIAVELAPEGLLTAKDAFDTSWKMVAQGDGVYYLLTSQSNYLPYGAFGNLFKITISNLGAFVNVYAGSIEDAMFELNMRVDNQIYVSPAAPGHPSETKFFLYPGGQTNIGRALLVGEKPDLAAPAVDIPTLAFPVIDPESENAWDLDEDGLPDFNDPVIDNEGLPGSLLVPNPLDIPAGAAFGQFRLRNNRLDTIVWSVDDGSLPSWVLAVTYGQDQASPKVSPSFVLHPGFSEPSEYVNLMIDYSGLDAGRRYQETIVVDTDVFGPQELPVSILAPSSK